MTHDHLTAHPLHWPLQQPRTPLYDRRTARFQSTSKASGARRPLTITEAYKRLIEELRLYNRPTNERVPLDQVVISTNVPLRRDGAPQATAREPADSGVAVYFTLDEASYCLPCDRWDRVADNLAAIAAHIEALRGQERWGVGTTHTHYAGFLALPPAPRQEPWYQVLDVAPEATPEQIKEAYRRLVKDAHPDRGGSTVRFQELTEAKVEGLLPYNSKSE